MRIAETKSAFKSAGGYFDAVNIIIDASPESDLKWPQLEGEIQAVLDLGAKLSFEFHFGLKERNFIFQDRIGLFSRKVALGHFTDKFYSRYEKDTVNATLYRGSIDFSALISKHEETKENFFSWLKETFQTTDPSRQQLDIFSTNLLMEYLHLLGAGMADSLHLMALLQFRGDKRPSEIAELLSRERFPHISPAVRNSPIPFEGYNWGEGSFGIKGVISTSVISKPDVSEPTIGVIIPEEGKVDYERLDGIIKDLNQAGKAFSIFPECLTTESWFGLDEIIAISDVLSEEGVRMLRGFNAAGGRAVIDGERIPLLESQISYPDFKKESLDPALV